MTELEKPPALAARGGCWFRGGGLEVHLGVEHDFHRAGKAHPGILVEDIRRLADHLDRNGVEVLWDDNSPGHERFYAFDGWETASSSSNPRRGESLRDPLARWPSSVRCGSTTLDVSNVGVTPFLGRTSPSGGERRH